MGNCDNIHAEFFYDSVTDASNEEAFIHDFLVILKLICI